jgi:hypothetical protein
MHDSAIRMREGDNHHLASCHCDTAILLLLLCFHGVMPSLPSQKDKMGEK